MNMIIVVEIAVIILLILINGIFAMSELAVVSARPVRLKQQADSGSLGARAALELADNPRQFLSTVQIGITLVGILAGAFAGATIADVLSQWLSTVPAVTAYSETIAFAIVVLCITYFSIVIGELIPKSIALTAPERIASLVSRPMKVVSRLSYPAVWLLSAPTAAVVRLLGLHAKVEPPVTDDELRNLISIGTEAGVFEPAEQDLIGRVIELESQRVTALMTPRVRISWIDLDAPDEVIRQEFEQSRFTRLPVARGRLDSIVGYVSAKDVLGHMLRTSELNVEAVLRRPLYIPESVTVLELLEDFRGSKTHLAVIVDEFGGVEGIVTMHDLLSVIVGDLANSPHASIEKRITVLETGGIVMDGRLPMIAFREALGLKALPEDDEEGYQTVGGFALSRLGHIPSVGEKFVWGKYEFSIDAMDRHRVSRITATPIVDSTEDGSLAG